MERGLPGDDVVTGEPPFRRGRARHDTDRDTTQPWVSHAGPVPVPPWVQPWDRRGGRGSDVPAVPRPVRRRGTPPRAADSSRPRRKREPPPHRCVVAAGRPDDGPGQTPAGFRVSVVEADPSWPAQFSLLRDALLPVVGDLAVTVEHVGSTAVPGLAAKPVLDVDVVVPDATARRAAGQALAGAGWRPEGDLGIEGRDAFAARPGLPPHHLYVVVDGSPAHRDHVDLRDHLRSHPADARPTRR